MAIIQPRDKTYKRFVFDPEDVGEVYPTINGERVEFGDADSFAEAIQAGGKFDFDRDIREGATKINVTYRVLNSDDWVWVKDHVRQLQNESGDSENDFQGAQQKDAVRLAVVDWSLKTPPWNDETLAMLDRDLFLQLFAWVSWKGVPDEQDPVNGLPLAEELVLPAPNRAERRATAKKPAAKGSSRSRRSTPTSPAATP